MDEVLPPKKRFYSYPSMHCDILFRQKWLLAVMCFWWVDEHLQIERGHGMWRAKQSEGI